MSGPRKPATPEQVAECRSLVRRVAETLGNPTNEQVAEMIDLISPASVGRLLNPNDTQGFTAMLTLSVSTRCKKILGVEHPEGVVLRHLENAAGAAHKAAKDHGGFVAIGLGKLEEEIRDVISRYFPNQNGTKP